jgi:hypothetical protein
MGFRPVVVNNPYNRHPQPILHTKFYKAVGWVEGTETHLVEYLHTYPNSIPSILDGMALPQFFS